MAETVTSEKKVRSIRADEETFNRFKEICEQVGGQQEALTALISSYELSNAKSILTGQADNIDDFKSRIDGLVRVYINALDMTANAEERIKGNFKERIESQAKTIEMLQLKAEVAESNLKALQDATSVQIADMTNKLNETEKRCQSLAKQAETANKECEQAERISAMTTERAEQLKEQVAELTAKAEQSDSYKAKAEQATADLEEHKRQSDTAINSYKAEIAQLKEQLRVEQADKEKELKSAEKEKETAVKLAIAETREKYQDKIEELQTKQAEQLVELSKIKTNRTKKEGEPK